jgi:flagellar hook-associated protein 1 FlgK
MSIDVALNSAFSGLKASSKAVELSSTNVANALNKSYARRDLELSTIVLGGATAGVQVRSVERAENAFLTGERLSFSARTADLGYSSNAVSSVADVVGAPTEENSLVDRVSTFQVALVAAGNDPDSTSLQIGLLNAAKALTEKLNELSDNNQRLREDADAQIAADVGRLNVALAGIEDLNADILVAKVKNLDTSGLQDNRQELIDSIAEIVPLRVVERENGQLALFAQGGGVLLDGAAREFSFEPTRAITTGMTLASGALEPLEVEGRIADVGAGGGLFDGGRLSAAFAQRDIDIPEFDQQIDAIARDLIERFQDPAVDPSLAVTDAGLFTDAGTVFDPLDELGLAARIGVNAAVDPDRGGEYWRLRDGINAAIEGEAGDATLLRAMSVAMSDSRIVSAGFGSTFQGDFVSLVTEFSSQMGYRLSHGESQLAFAQSQFATVRETELAEIGVDTDGEMRRLLEIEQAYAANARVVTVVDSLMQRLMEI